MSKRTRITIIAVFLWITAALTAGFIYFIKNSRTLEYTAANSFISGEDLVYISDNYGDNGLIWMTDLKGKVQKLFTTKESRLLAGWNIADLEMVDENIHAVFTRRYNDSGRVVNQYCVAIFNEQLGMNYLSPVFRFPIELNLTGFSASESDAYLTALSSNGQQAYVYDVPNSAFIALTGEAGEDREKWKNGEVTPTEIEIRESVWPRYFTEAEYLEGNINLRYDNSEPGVFETDNGAAGVYGNIRLDPGLFLKMRGISPILPVLVVIIGGLLIVAVSLLFRNRRRVVYVIAVFEVLMFVAAAGVVFFIARYGRETAENEFVRFGTSDAQSVFDGYGMVNMEAEDFYNSTEYETLSERLKRRTGTDGAGVVIEDMLVVNALTGNVVMSASGHNRQALSAIYGGKAGSLLTGLSSGDDYGFEKIVLKGRNLAILETSLSSAGQQAYALVTVAESKSVFNGLFSDLANCFRYILVIFLVGSVLGLVFIALQGFDLNLLRRALSQVARGEEPITKRNAGSQDINFMWNSLSEIRKNIVNTNRIKFLTYEAYFRFAPKSVEKILKKQSITEVKCGDSVSSSGALAVLKTGADKADLSGGLTGRSWLLNAAEECRSEYDGILISHNDDLGEIKFLFTEENRNGIDFGSDLILKLREEKSRGFARSTMIMHYAAYSYGIAGDERQAAVYFSSPEKEILESYADWLNSLRLGLVVTGQLLEREKRSGDYRYIGFIIPDEKTPDRRIKLYEVLDAEIPMVRNRKARQKKRFEEALEHFYKKDFYLARGVFSDILRESPDDELAKWYLFECERYLDNGARGEFMGELHFEA
ncbi:MAG: hypothetical protein IJ796_03480 [Lachnospiraceae bacterium]|nr:hypothetical protein [Lachnospiraceae bacterium]